ncbi:cytochrome c [Novosphingobium flavum]|uniref:Cytochrome c n=1 Tax=Novosphingobium flavum TaxID=1778672 RepID=A0A7X1FTS9_9SPHN|nr:cytochrome c [Novosphingobium flavum]MBC2666859.1 cytochrome c [Novosphingobium flavum]
MKTVKLAAIAALILPATAMVAIAAAPADVIKARQDNFKIMGKAMKGTMDEFKLPSPNPAVVKANANALAAAAVKVKGGFPKGTGAETGVKTDALPVIWQKPADFKAADAKMAAAAKAFQAAANTGDLAKMQAAAGAVGQTCKGCHDTFRKPRS